MVSSDKKNEDAYGQMLLAQLVSGEKLCEVIRASG
jgi:hypothetical protein